MTQGKKDFIDYVELLMANANTEMTKEANDFWTKFKEEKVREKPTFTDNGKLVITYMKQNNSDGTLFSAKEIAEGLMVSARTVSGSMRKLIGDGFAVKATEDPVTYKLTEKGINIIIEE